MEAVAEGVEEGDAEAAPSSAAGPLWKNQTQATMPTTALAPLTHHRVGTLRV